MSTPNRTHPATPTWVRAICWLAGGTILVFAAGYAWLLWEMSRPGFHFG